MRNKIKEKLTNIEKKITPFVILFIGICFLSAIYTKYSTQIRDFFKSKSWTLFIYTNNKPDIAYQRARIDGYKSQKDCLEKGLLLIKEGESLQCGYFCRNNENNIFTCKKICDTTSCKE